MYRPHPIVGTLIFLSGFLLFTFVAGIYHADAHASRRATGSVCPGFVVLSNGYAVLSATPAAQQHRSGPAHHGAAHQDHAMAPQTGNQMAPPHEQMMHKRHAHAGEMSQPSGAQQHLMGYQHGQDITLQKGMLCVPIGSPDDTTWTTVSSDPSLSVMAESLKGALTHNSRANEAFALTVMQRGASPSAEAPRVRVLARMPHHDRQMPGGHGLANDPDVQGLTAGLHEAGRYRVQTVDFPMAGAWLIEVQVQQGGNVQRAYFAVDVGEE